MLTSYNFMLHPRLPLPVDLEYHINSTCIQFTNDHACCACDCPTFVRLLPHGKPIQILNFFVLIKISWSNFFGIQVTLKIMQGHALSLHVVLTWQCIVHVVLPYS